MTNKQNGAGGYCTGKSYKDAVLTNVKQQYSRGLPPNPHVAELIGSLRKLMSENPDGVSLNEVRKVCPLLYHTDVLKNFPSVQHLLASMPTVVQLQGIGVQTRVLPPGSQSSQDVLASMHSHGGGLPVSQFHYQH